ncbi:putative Zn-dependent alcohol dehydrogenase [Nocardia nova SH22a]|uniref:Putative Zn-dependent alcohol dehydrogenase n=1 Tax=Nocardia nova SH22a TaxID=1415166 RepID=W5TSP1_9NOCA|nr:NADP-dependent oxidoreductase [Nocardia nova]AHH20246.1 putative Zn-dependent alcohol dehydrogenase [Nocardia nova SH22a]
MLAIGFEVPGGPEVLRPVEVPEPHAGAGEVRISVAAAAVNPSDTVTRSGMAHDRYRAVRPPYVPGWDAAGIVDEADPATGWRPGDRVVAITLPVLAGGGAYAEKIVVPAGQVARLPEGSDFASAATLPMNGLTAWFALAALAPQTGTIAVTGAAGAVGGYVIQLAKIRGYTVIADAKPADEQLVRDLGADIVLPRGAVLAARIREHAPVGVDALIDTALQGDAVLAAVRDGGDFVLLRPAALGGGATPERDISVHLVMVADHLDEPDALRELSRLAASDALTLRVARTFPADQAASAHELLEAGGLRGRIVLEFPTSTN